jgi:hypothetical protein
MSTASRICRRLVMSVVSTNVALGWLLLAGITLAEMQDPIKPNPETQTEQGAGNVPDDPSKTYSATETEQRREQINAGEVVPRGLSPAMMPGRMAPAGKSLIPGATFSALTKAECTGLGCKAVTDNTCPDVGALKERCLCKPGTKGVCIDAVK